jgi:hypothetical protein
MYYTTYLVTDKGCTVSLILNGPATLTTLDAKDLTQGTTQPLSDPTTLAPGMYRLRGDFVLGAITDDHFIIAYSGEDPWPIPPLTPEVVRHAMVGYLLNKRGGT